MMSALRCFDISLSGSFNIFGTIKEVVEDSFLTVTNPEKLALTGIPVGQVVHVTDGLKSVTQSTANINLGDADGFYTKGPDINGKHAYYFTELPISNVGGFGTDYGYFWDSGSAYWFAQFGGGAFLASNEDVAEPWLVTVWKDGNDLTTTVPTTLTHPAVQQYAAASTAQGGVLVAGGTQDGVYSTQGESNGKDYYVILGDANDGNAHRVIWSTEAPIHDDITGWWIKDSSTLFYYSLSDVATPDLATGWLNASDDTPAGITVASVTQGELDAGVKIGSIIRVVNGSTSGLPKYADVLAANPDVTWNGEAWSDGSTNIPVFTAFPWQAPLGTRDNIASEANWTVT